MVLCLCFSMISDVVYATDYIGMVQEDNEDVTAIGSTNDYFQAQSTLPPVILEEIVDMRTINEKYFICDDGSYMAVSYPEAVHKQYNGKWVDADYPLKSDGQRIQAVLGGTNVYLASIFFVSTSK